ncbi:MAG TPA: CDP-alcohol phosphatidyltransferase family protein [Steroidobacteraceae bacterium]
MSAPSPHLRGWVRHLPNIVSAARIAATPALVYCAVRGNEAAFTWILVPALLSDIVDGLLARALQLQSKLGALLDSIGDVLLLFTSIFGIWTFEREVILDHQPWCVALVAAWLVEILAALLRYGRLSSFHTYVSKVAGYLLGIFVGVLFVFGFQPWLMYAAVATSVLGNLEELVLLRLLPEWRADVRGVHWVLRERRRGQLAS